MKKYRGMRIAAVSLALILAGTVSSLRTVRASETDAQTAVYLVVGEEEQNETFRDRCRRRPNFRTEKCSDRRYRECSDLDRGSRGLPGCMYCAARKKQRI